MKNKLMILVGLREAFLSGLISWGTYNALMYEVLNDNGKEGR